MTEITKIDGSPGAGKSYKLKQFLKKEKENGLHLGDFAYVTFTNAATNDEISEVADIMRCEEDDAPVRTLHSMALGEVSKAGMIEDFDQQIISQKSEKGKPENIYRDFCEREALEYNAATIKDAVEQGKKGGAGDKLFRINAWLSLTRRDAQDAALAPVKMPWSTEMAVTLLDKWDAFKAGYGELSRYEHPDYVDLAIDHEYAPDVEVLFIDEFQDLSPQEYLYYKVMRDSPSVERVYIAGDPNQSVYSFRAGTPHYFNETPADNEIYLSETRRCRGEIADFARQVLNVGPGANTDFNAHKDGGSVETVDANSDARLADALESAVADGKVFMLARTNSKVYSIKRWLKSHGYPFSTVGERQYSMWTTEAYREIVGALSRLTDAGERVPVQGINTLLAHSPEQAQPDELVETGGRLYDTASVWRAFPYADTVTDVIAELDYETDTRRALNNAVLNDNRNEYEQIQVGTIHAAKGLEAPNVLLFNSYNKHLRDAYYSDTDTRKEEHRLGYVGATRAKDQLYIIDGFFDGPRMKPLEKARKVGVKA